MQPVAIELIGFNLLTFCCEDGYVVIPHSLRNSISELRWLIKLDGILNGSFSVGISRSGSLYHLIIKLP